MSSELVVILDDSLTNRKILERLVISLGDDTIAKSFADPDRALAFCAEHQPDLVVMADPAAGCAAADLIRRLREENGCAGSPVLVVAGDDEHDGIERAREAGAGDHLISPIDHREFRTRARHLLASRRAPPAIEETGEASEIRQLREERRREEGLNQAHEALLRVIDFIPVMVCVTGRDGRYIFVNHRFAAFVGVRANRLIGKRPVEVHDDALAAALTDSDARLLAGEQPPASFEEEILDRDGKRRVLLTTKSLLHGSDGEASMLVTVLLDITARKTAELDMRQAKEQAEIANRSKTEFLATMSHELRTPLNAIIGFSQVIAGEMLGPIGTTKYAGYAGDILASAEHLLGVINDILDVARLEAGKLELVEEIVHVTKAIAELAQLIDGKARGAQVQIAVRHEGAIPPLRADIRKLKQIVFNLLSNAIKFSHPGGEVDIVLRNAAGAVSIAVVDRGIGMDEHEVELATSRFGQVASPWTRRHDGTGLGLPLAIGLIELHGGLLEISSSKGAGTTVTVTFPRERSAALSGSPLDAIAASGAA